MLEIYGFQVNWILVSFSAVAFLCALFLAYRIYKRNERKKAENEAIQKQTKQKTDEFIRLSTQYFGGMPMLKKEDREKVFFGISDKNFLAISDWLDTQGLLDDKTTVSDVVVDDTKRIRLTLSEYEDLFDHLFGEGAFDKEIPVEFKTEIAKYNWMPERKKPDRVLVVEAKNKARMLSNELERRISAEVSDLNAVRKECANLAKRFAQFFDEIYPLALKVVENSRLAEEERLKEVENFRKAREEYHAHTRELLKKPGALPLENVVKDITKLKEAFIKFDKVREDMERLPAEVRKDIKKVVKRADELEGMLEQAQKDNDKKVEDIYTFIREEMEKIAGQFIKIKQDRASEGTKSSMPVWLSNVMAFGVAGIAVAFYFYAVIEHGDAILSFWFSDSTTVQEDSLLSDSDPVKSEMIFVKGRPEDLNPLPHMEKPKVEKSKEVCDTVPAFTPVVKKQEEACTTKACCYLKISFDKKLTEDQRAQSRREASRCVQMLK